MNKYVWWNPHLPQTLMMPLFFGYFQIVFAALLHTGGGLINGFVPVLFAIATGVGAFGIANIRLWGYVLSVVGFVGQFVYEIIFYLQHGASIGDYFQDTFLSTNVISSIIRIAVIIALFHPMSTRFVKLHFEKTIP